MNSRRDRIERALREKLSPLFLEIVDQTALHAAHEEPGAGGHFSLLIVSPLFEGKSPVERHRAVYTAMGEALAKDEVHALAIKAYSPSEWKK